MKVLEGKKIAILVANGFEQVEMTMPKKALEDAGAKTFIISPEKEKVQGSHHDEKADFFPIDVPLAQANAKDYDAIHLPGGVFNPDRLRVIPEAVNFVKHFVDAKKPIAVICHGPWTLINAQGVKGKTMTSWISLKQDLINAGANWIDQEVVVDDLLVTSRKPADIPAYNEKMIQLFAKK
jgi:deglycase